MHYEVSLLLPIVPFTQYTIIARARNGAALGTEASLVNVFTAQRGMEQFKLIMLYIIFISFLVPDMVNGVMAQRPSHTGMVVSWSEPSQPMSQTLGYEVTYSPLGSLGSEVSVSVSGDITTTHVGGIEPNLAYNVRVRALSVMGYGPYSTTASVPGRCKGH